MPAAGVLAARTQAPIELAAQHLLVRAAIAAQSRIAVRLPTGAKRPVSCYFATFAEEGAPACALAHLVIAGLPGRGEERVMIRPGRDIRIKIDPDIPYDQPPNCHIKTLPTYAPLKKQAQRKVAAGRVDGGLFAGHPDDVVEPGPQRRAEAARLCRRWDGHDPPPPADEDTAPRWRAETKPAPLSPPLSIHLVAAPRAGRAFLGDPDLADGGLLARFLTVLPHAHESPRVWQQAEDDAPPPAFAALQALWDKVRGEESAERRIVGFSEPAKRAWLAFANEMETELAPGGAFAAIRPLAGRLAEHAARLAAVIAFSEDPARDVLDAPELERGIALARFYASEALRAAGRASDDIVGELQEWLEQKRWNQSVTLRDICRFGPSAVRNVDIAYKTIRKLERLGIVHPRNDVTKGDEPRRARALYEWYVGETSQDVA
ncbi:MAG: DUF3987 domain-containing protein [Rhodospirillaceae bacterium]